MALGAPSVAEALLRLKDEDDPVISAFLSFIAKDMAHHITDLDAEQMDRIDRLVGHIEVDPDEDLGDESLL